jgi:SPP1 gp7 family putative phage head morphogenesis protein
MSELLTKKKKRWANQFKPNVIKGTPLTPNMMVAQRYYKTLEKMVNTMSETIEKRIISLFESELGEQYFAQDESIASQARITINELARRFDELFAERSKIIADRVAAQSDKAALSAVQESLKQMSGGLVISQSAMTDDINEILKASVAENVQLIRSISQQYLKNVQGAVMRSITTGRGLQDLVPYLHKQRSITLRRSRIIAMDQTRKAYGALSQKRMRNAGVKKFEWLHTGGSNEPRKLHQHLSGQIFSYDNPPIIDKTTGERGFPAQLINCRCKAIPVLEFSGD